ncbi:hypothetical protein [Aurantiacibacter gangjinensis]|uniref:Uncharacterized protein n=1 Tax=Aurantiacibacter gangjinensis TaxID=502682 RepID=A0A0G9MS14_9SPHN|nr:hypothetical protein [Aurantiacibacter gangjinensis]APE27099.1 hypothetical protein BMF35_a0270 [Aurantiacibacter gangjinensis]KLE33517.1 hypothetical protein AAW01_06335 [Aurantiacibacter gangjinensis]
MDEGRPDESKAKQRFLFISLMRVAGVVMVLLGLIITTDTTPLPNWLGWVLVALGVTEALLVPQALARKWSSKNRK